MADFSALLAEAGVSRPWLASRVGRSLGAVSRWCDGTAAAPGEVVAWLERRIGDPPPTLAPYAPVPPGRVAK